jgi:hypothetical protein
VTWWRGLDSNQRKVSLTDLQSVAFDRSATPPLTVCTVAFWRLAAGLGEGPDRVNSKTAPDDAKSSLQEKGVVKAHADSRCINACDIVDRRQRSNDHTVKCLPG